MNDKLKTNTLAKEGIEMAISFVRKLLIDKSVKIGIMEKETETI